MRYVGLLLLLLLAAYIGAQQMLIAASAGEVLPAEAQRVIDRATATAGILATQGAQATASQRAVSALATAAIQHTRESSAVEQTHVALQLTAGAGAALATDGAAVKTQAAQQTAAWSTPTAAAMQTRAAIDEQDQARRQANAEHVAEFWRTLREVLLELVKWGAITVVVLALSGGLARVVVVLVDRLTQIRIDRMREKAAIAREAFRVVSPGHWAEWQPANGYQVYPLPNSVIDVPPSTEPALASPSHLHAWRQTMRLFAWWGERYGFGIRELGAEGVGVITDPAWRRLTRILKAAGVLADVAIEGRKGRGTAWADGWDYRRFADELSSGKLALPFPANEPPPQVAGTVPTQHHN